MEKWNELTQEERDHLKNNSIETNDDLKRQVDYLQNMKRKTNGIPCYQCMEIAKKLGMW